MSKIFLLFALEVPWLLSYLEAILHIIWKYHIQNKDFTFTAKNQNCLCYNFSATNKPSSHWMYLLQFTHICCYKL